MPECSSMELRKAQGQGEGTRCRRGESLQGRGRYDNWEMEGLSPKQTLFIVYIFTRKEILEIKMS